MKKVLLSTVFYFMVFVCFSQTPKGLNVNDKAPEFSAISQNGNNISLKAALQKGPVVVVFYRGEWCPYCNKYLMHLQDSLPFIKAKGARLIAITPEKPENISKTIAKTKASYPILFDKGLQIMKAYDVDYAIDSVMLDKYKKYGIDFNIANGENGEHLPVPAVYVINKEGKIVYKFFEPDFRIRASIKEILQHL